MNYIKVWCEYDFSGQFGGNNNEEVFAVSNNLSSEQTDQLVDNYLVQNTGVDLEELEGLYSWEYIEMEELK